MVLEKTLESPLGCQVIIPDNPEEISPEYSLEAENIQCSLKLKLQYLSHLMRGTDPFEKTLMVGKIEGRRRRGQ